MNVLIFGSGAVGLGIGSCLLKAGVETALLAGDDTIAALQTNGLPAREKHGQSLCAFPL